MQSKCINYNEKTYILNLLLLFNIFQLKIFGYSLLTKKNIINISVFFLLLFENILIQNEFFFSDLIPSSIISHFIRKIIY